MSTTDYVIVIVAGLIVVADVAGGLIWASRPSKPHEPHHP